MIYPEGIWYGDVTVADVPEIIERTIVNGEVIERLLIPDDRYKPCVHDIPETLASDLTPEGYLMAATRTKNETRPQRHRGSNPRSRSVSVR